MNKKISELPAADLPLSGVEKVEIVQGGINKQVDSSELGGGGSGAVDSVNGQTGVVVLNAGDVGADPAGSAAAAQAASQPLDSDLTAIAALTPSNDDVLQRKAGAWTNRTLAQLGADLQTVNIGNLLYLYNNFV